MFMSVAFIFFKKTADIGMDDITLSGPGPDSFVDPLFIPRLLSSFTEYLCRNAYS